MISSGFQTLVHLVYPSRCVGCGDLVEGDFGLCGPCWRDTPFVNGVICDQCGLPLPGGQIGEIAQCDECMRRARPWERGRAALVYQDAARRLVLRLKHSDRSDVVRPAAGWMARVAQDLVASDSVLVPVPLHWRRMMGRKYNQSALLAQAMARLLDVPCCPDALLRRRTTRALHGSRAERSEILRDAIIAHPRRHAQIEGRSVLLVDDVMTTGATLESSARALLEMGPGKIDVITLARVAIET